MDKKDIYEHLANIYLDASLKRKKKAKEHLIFKSPFLISFFVILAFSALVFFTYQSKDRLLISRDGLTSEFALVIQPNIAKLNFNFDPAKKEVYSINLNKLDLSRFKAIGFSVRKAKFEDNITLKIEFTNASNEKAEIYLKDIPAYRWKAYKFDLAFFKNITEWQEMSNLSFVVEELETKEKNGIVYLDNIRFLR